MGNIPLKYLSMMHVPMRWIPVDSLQLQIPPRCNCCIFWREVSRFQRYQTSCWSCSVIKVDNGLDGLEPTGFENDSSYQFSSFASVQLVMYGVYLVSQQTDWNWHFIVLSAGKISNAGGFEQTDFKVLSWVCFPVLIIQTICGFFVFLFC